MPDVMQEMADVQAAIGRLQEPDSAYAAPPAPDRVFLRHPHTADVHEVDGTPEALVPWMCRGYVQFQPAPATPAKGE
jgi:hypothetical protein